MRGNGSVLLTCARCGVAFTVPAYRAQTAHYCGRTCADLGHRGKPSPKDQRVTLHCEACGAAFKVKAGRAAERRFCSMACSAKHQRRVLDRPRDASKREMHSCRECGAAVESWVARAHPFCSPRCYIAYRQSKATDRFWARVNKQGPLPPGQPEIGPCWLWTGSLCGSGYGVVSFRGRRIMAHRLSYELAHRAVPAASDVLHRCDVKACVRPDHLYAGTQSDNNRDMWNRERRSHTRKLTADDVHRIRALYTPERASSPYAEQRRLSEVFGVHPMTIRDIVTRRIWKHL